MNHTVFGERCLEKLGVFWRLRRTTSTDGLQELELEET
jgi:hypothetical protein